MIFDIFQKLGLGFELYIWGSDGIFGRFAEKNDGSRGSDGVVGRPAA